MTLGRGFAVDTMDSPVSLMKNLWHWLEVGATRLAGDFFRGRLG